MYRNECTIVQMYDLPPMIAQILVKKCKNGICSSLKLTCNIKHIGLSSKSNKKSLLFLQSEEQYA